MVAKVDLHSSQTSLPSFVRKDCLKLTSPGLFFHRNRPLLDSELDRVLSVDWTAEDMRGDTLFKCRDGWQVGFRNSPPPSRIPLDQPGFAINKRRPRHFTDTSPVKKMCLVLDPPRTTVEGQQAPVTSHMAWRILRPRAPYIPQPTLVEGEEVVPISCDVSSPSGDYFEGCGYPMTEDQPQVPGDPLNIPCEGSLELGIPPENGDFLSHTKNSVSYFASACGLS